MEAAETVGLAMGGDATPTRLLRLKPDYGVPPVEARCLENWKCAVRGIDNIARKPCAARPVQPLLVHALKVSCVGSKRYGCLAVTGTCNLSLTFVFEKT